MSRYDGSLLFPSSPRKTVMVPPLLYASSSSLSFKFASNIVAGFLLLLSFGWISSAFS